MREDGDQLVEDVVRQGVEVADGDVVGRADARHADGVRTHAPAGFQVLRVHQQADELVAVVAEAEQDADAHVVTAAFLGSVHGFSMPGVVALGAGGVQALVILLVVSLLEQDVCADAGFVQLAVGFDSPSPRC
jgi:hypothetical protein